MTSIVPNEGQHQVSDVEIPSSKKSFDEKWMDVTTHRAWRHTIGRISCLARIPIYAIATTLQTCKFLIKASFSPFVSFGRWATGSKKLESWSFSGVGRDMIMIGSLIERTMNSALCVIFAPPTQYRSLLEAFSDYFSIVFMGGQHNETSRGVATPGELFKMLVLVRPQYCGVMFDSYTIGSEKMKILSLKCQQNVKAG